MVNQGLIIPTDEESQGNSLELLLPTPTPIPFTIEGVAFYETPVGSLWCLGEVVNGGATSLENVQAQVDWFDHRDTSSFLRGPVAAFCVFCSTEVGEPESLVLRRRLKKEKSTK